MSRVAGITGRMTAEGFAHTCKACVRRMQAGSKISLAAHMLNEALGRSSEVKAYRPEALLCALQDTNL